MGILNEYGVSEQQAQEVQAQRAPGAVLPSGVYDAEIVDAYIERKPSGSEMLNFEFKLANGQDFKYSTAVKSKAGKTTFTRDGKEHLMLGLQELIRVARLLLGKEDVDAVKEFKEINGKPVEVKRLKDLIGKKVKLGIRQEENLYNGNITLRNYIHKWMNENGEIEDGTKVDAEEAAWLEKNPVKKSRATAGTGAVAATPTPGVGTDALASSGW